MNSLLNKYDYSVLIIYYTLTINISSKYQTIIMKSLPISNWSNKSANANEEWPEIINTRNDNPLSNEMIRVEYHEVKTKTIDDETKKQIDIKEISANDLESIRREDPFMYYSIPGVRISKMLMKDGVDTSDLSALSTIKRSCFSSPSRLETVQGKAQETVVRKSCISFECHPDLLLEEEFSMNEHDDFDEDVEDPLELLLSKYGSSSH